MGSPLLRRFLAVPAEIRIRWLTSSMVRYVVATQMSLDDCEWHNVIYCGRQAGSVEFDLFLLNIEFMIKMRPKTLPTDLLRSRAFARELKKAVLGFAGWKPDYPLISLELEKNGRLVTFAAASWNDWWHGRRIPNTAIRNSFDHHYDRIASLWLEPHCTRHRIVTLFSAIDFAHAPESNSAELWQLLMQLQREWQPDLKGFILLPSSKERQGFDWRKEELVGTNFGANWQPDQRAALPIGFVKGPRTALRFPASRTLQALYQPLSPVSLLHFMLGYALENGLDEPGLKEAFILDFLTVLLAVHSLIISHDSLAYSRPNKYGQIAKSCMEFFFDEDYGYEDHFVVENHPIAHVLSCAITLGVEFDQDAAWRLLEELKSKFFETLCQSGLTQKELLHFLQEMLY